MSSVGIGEAACLGAAMCWAVAVGLFRGPIAEHGARAINLAKCLIAAPLLAATALVAGQGSVALAAPRRLSALQWPQGPGALEQSLARWPQPRGPITALWR